jgi:hypothetical protein
MGPWGGSGGHVWDMLLLGTPGLRLIRRVVWGAGLLGMKVLEPGHVD